jgi:hypothetical protein
VRSTLGQIFSLSKIFKNQSYSTPIEKLEFFYSKNCEKIKASILIKIIPGKSQ